MQNDKSGKNVTFFSKLISDETNCVGADSERLPVVKKWLVEHRQILGFM